jgi:AP-2 complex subunit alpha
MANPWLQAKLLRFLRFFPPTGDRTARSRLNDILKKILASSDVASKQTVNHKNALNCVLFEAIDLAIHLDE